jgi:hypothetical protein
LEAWDQKGNPLMILVTITTMSTMGQGTFRTHDAVGTTLVIIGHNQQHERRVEYQ